MDGAADDTNNNSGNKSNKKERVQPGRTSLALSAGLVTRRRQEASTALSSLSSSWRTPSACAALTSPCAAMETREEGAAESKAEQN